MQLRGISFSTWVVLVSQLLMNTASFMAIPFLAVYMNGSLGFSSLEVGTILTLLLLASRLAQLMTGPLADRLGYKRMIVVGMEIRAVGLLGFALFQGFWPLAITALVVGLGGAIYDPAVSAVFAAQPDAIRPHVFSIHNLFLNIGAVGGPALGGLIIVYGPRTSFLASALIFALIGLLVALVHVPRQAKTSSMLQNYRKVLAHAPFRLLLLIMTLWWVLFSQLSISFPMQMTVWGGKSWVSSIFMVNGSVGIAMAFVVNYLMARVLTARVLNWGFLILAIAFGLVPFYANAWWLLACVALYTCAETILLVGADLLIASYTDSETGATFYGIYMLSWAVGGSIGNYLGSWLSISLQNAQVTWTLYALIAAVALVLMRTYRRRYEGAVPSRVERIAEG